MHKSKPNIEYPIGPSIDPRPAKTPGQVTLPGRFVTVTPLDPVTHGCSLYEGTYGSEQKEKLWRYMFDGPFPSRAAFDCDLQSAAASTDPLFYAVLDNSTGRAIGRAAYLRITPAHRAIEVGSIVYTPQLQRTAGATEAMYLMAAYVFEVLGYRRYEWKCDFLNALSRRAALRLGFTLEGTFRQHMIVKGRSRDTAWYSMLDCEWPVRKAAFERWLDPSNFDEAGQQKLSLSSLSPAAR